MSDENQGHEPVQSEPSQPERAQPSQPHQTQPEAKGSVDKRGILTVVVIFGGLFLMLLLFAVVVITAFGGDGFGEGKDQVGVIEITGPIMESKDTVEDIRRFVRQDNIEGIVVRVDSPGGAVAPSQEIYQAVKRASDEKPVVVSMGSTAASGGYYIALGSEHIIANSGTVTGSIGVISQLFNIEGLLEHVDVRVHTIKTGKFKDAGSPFREFDDEEREYFASLLNDIYEQFIEDVAKERGMELDAVREVADGRVFTGRQAQDLELVDQLGTFHDAVDWIKDKADIDGEAALVYPPEEELGILTRLIEGATDAAVNKAKTSTTPVVEYRLTR
ncbi:MAG: signal peptide peptidase SppA [Persicimonas sp.]